MTLSLESVFWLILEKFSRNFEQNLEKSGGGHLDKTGDGYVRAIRVLFFIPQKSLKGFEIHKLVSERVPKSRKSKIVLLKGSQFSKILSKIRWKSSQIWWKLSQIFWKNLSKGPEIA